MPTDHYATLQVERTASPEDIKKSYRRLVRTTHPDVEGGSAEAFREVQAAYEVLSDPVKKRTYDYSLSVGGTTAPNSRPFGTGTRPDFNAYAQNLLQEQLRRAEAIRKAEEARLAAMAADLEDLRRAHAPYRRPQVLGRILGEVYSAHRAAGVPFSQVAGWRRLDSILGIVIGAAFLLVAAMSITFAVTGTQPLASAILTIVGSGVVAAFLMLTQLVGFNLYRYVNYSIPNITSR